MMRLLNSLTYQFEEFPGKAPEYAILSHTWGEEEVSFQDVRDGTAKSRAGYRKVEFVCNQARKDGLSYVWDDTCCINKDSSAELSETINSMYRWYQEANVCYAYLTDVPADVDLHNTHSAFSNSRWLTRGWTLQELIAPSNLLFFSSDGTILGKKLDLSRKLARITGIHRGVLSGSRKLESMSVAAGISWVSRRKATPIEDIAYCLLGIFSVNMPMLYGEGERSFIRLQQDIIRDSDDQSIFAWQNRDAHRNICDGLLARSPKYFVDSSDFVPLPLLDDGAFAHSLYAFTNKGLQITFNVEPLDNGCYRIPLGCYITAQRNNAAPSMVCVYLQQVSPDSKQFVRVFTNQYPIKSGVYTEHRTIYVRQRALTVYRSENWVQHMYCLRTPKILDCSERVIS